MSYLLPLALTVVAVAVTYLTCIRPMRRGHGCHTAEPDSEPALEAQIRQLRHEVQLLRDLELRTRRDQVTSQSETLPQ